MTDTLTGAKLAETIEKVVTMLPDNHDQGYWFYTYETKEHFQAVDPESIKLVQIMDAVEAGEAEAQEVKCNTTLCTAGWALMLNGYTLTRSDYEDIAVKDGVHYDIFSKARELLDLDSRTADVLFDGDTSNEDAVEILGYIGRNDKAGAEDYISDMGHEICDCGCSDEDGNY